MMPLFRPARVTVTFTDGSTLDGSTETNRGDAEDPYSAAELTEKYYELTARAWDRPTAEAVYGAIAGLDALAGMDALTGPMDAAGPAETAAAE